MANDQNTNDSSKPNKQEPTPDTDNLRPLFESAGIPFGSEHGKPFEDFFVGMPLHRLAKQAADR